MVHYLYFNKKIASLIFFSFVLIFPIVSVAQSEKILIKGKVTDAYSKKPLPFAGILIKETSMGAVCKNDGTFRLAIPKEHNTKLLEISYIGYKSKTIPITEFKNRLVHINLKPESHKIEKVIIRPGLAERILTKALDNVENNYPVYPQKQKAYYKETVKDNGKYIQHIELILEIFKTPYNNRKNDKIRAIQGRQKNNLSSSFLWDNIYFVNGPYEALSCDIAKYPNEFLEIPQHFVNFLNPNHFKFYSYKINFTEKAGKDIYIINFKPKHKAAFYSGTIVLDNKSYAFINLSYQIVPEKLKDAQVMTNDIIDYLRTKDLFVTTKNYRCNISYEQKKETLIFKQAIIQYEYQMENYKKNISSLIEYESMIFIDESSCKNVNPIKLHKRLLYDSNIKTQVPKYDSIFWNKYETPYFRVLKTSEK